MALGVASLFGGPGDNQYLTQVMGDPTNQTTPTTPYNVGSYGGYDGIFRRGNGLSNILGLGVPTRGVMDQQVQSDVSTPGRPFYNGDNELGRGSIGSRMGNRGYELQTPTNLSSSPNFYSTEFDPTTQTYGNGVKYGGNERVLNFNYDNNGDNVLSRAGFVGGQIQGDGSVQSDTRYGLVGSNSVSGSESTPSNYGRTFSDNRFNVYGSAGSPEDFAYDNTFRQNITGGARTQSQKGSLTTGDEYGGVVGASYDTPQQIGNMVLGSFLPGLSQVTQPLGQYLFGGPTIVTRDRAEAQATANQQLGGSASLSGPGELNFGRSATVGGEASATSPEFGNNVATRTALNTQQAGSLALNGYGINGNIGLDSNQIVAGNAGLEQTNTFRKGGLIPGFGGINKNTFQPLGYQGITQNSGGQLALTGQDTSSYGNAGLSQQNIAEVINQLNSNQKGFSNVKNNYTQRAISQEDIGANLQGKADVIGAADNQLDLYNAIGQNSGAKAQSQAAIEASLKAAGANVDAWAQAKQVLQGEVNSNVANSVRVQAQKFTDGIAEKFPNSPEAQQIIAFLQQDPANAWLFTGNNSPEVIMGAIASSVTNTQTPSTYNWQTQTPGGSDYYNLSRNTVNANINVDPNANVNVQRYKDYDPTPNDPNSGDEMVFANVNGEVRQIPKGMLADINFQDQFNIDANSNANNASANLNVKGAVKGKDYYFANGQDQMYNTLANEILSRSENTFNQEGQQLKKDLASVTTNMNNTQTSLSQAQQQLANTPQQIQTGTTYQLFSPFTQQWRNVDVNEYNANEGGKTSNSRTSPIYGANPAYAQAQSNVNSLSQQIQQLSQQQGQLTTSLQQNTTANSKTASDPIIEQINAMKMKNLSAEDKAYYNQLIEQRTNELNSGYETKVNTVKQKSQQLDDLFNQYQTLRNTQASEVVNPMEFNDNLSNLEQQMNAVRGEIQSLNLDISTNRPQQSSVGYNDVKDQFLQGKDSSKYADAYDAYGNTMMNNRSVTDYQDLIDNLQNERNFDTQYGISKGGNYVDLDSVGASAQSIANATTDRSNTWYPNQGFLPNLVRSRGSWSNLDPATGQMVSGGDPNLYSRMQLTGYNPNMLNQNIYDPLNINVSSYGIDQYFDPLRFSNDSNWTRLQEAKMTAIANNDAWVNNGGIYRTSL